MLSFGIEYDLAFSIAFWSARLLAGSPPPSFAATMIARESFEKSLPRFASAAPFLCLIDDHLLCPDKLSLLTDRFQKSLMQPRVVGQFRMKRGDEELPLAREHRPPVDLGEYLDIRPDLLDPRRPDEDSRERRGLADDVELGLERRNLAPEGVPPHRQVDQPEVLPVEHDHPGARPEHGAVERSHRLVEAVEAHQPHEGRRLAARDHEAVQPGELLGLP